MNNIGVILFDIDGVIRSVENSYRLSLKKTVYQFCGWDPSGHTSAPFRASKSLGMFLRRLAALAFQSNVHPPRGKRNEPKKGMFQQLKSIAKQVVTNGKKGEGYEGDHNADKTP